MALEPTLSKIHAAMSGPSANVQTTGNMNQTSKNGGSLFRCLLEPFNGDRSASKASLHRFETWANLNDDKDVFKNQFRKCSLFLTYIIGPNVDDWALAHMNEARANKTDLNL